MPLPARCRSPGSVVTSSCVSPPVASAATGGVARPWAMYPSQPDRESTRLDHLRCAGSPWRRHMERHMNLRGPCIGLAMALLASGAGAQYHERYSVRNLGTLGVPATNG